MIDTQTGLFTVAVFQDVAWAAKALDALKQAEAIRPDRPDVHRSLVDAYKLLGNLDKAREHVDKGNWLIEHLPK